MRTRPLILDFRQQIELFFMTEMTTADCLSAQMPVTRIWLGYSLHSEQASTQLSCRIVLRDD